MPRSRYAVAAIVIFLLISLPLTLLTNDERNGWVMMTNSLTTGGYSLFGYSYIANNQAIHIENVTFLNQTVFFNGIPTPLDWYAVRSLYSYAASLFAPYLGVLPALLLINYCCWAAAACIAWRFTRQIWNNELAALLAVVLVTGSIAMISQIRDYSSHLLSYTLYFGGVLAIYESRVWKEARPLSTHLRLGLYIAVTALAYNNAIMLLAGYLAVSTGRSPWYWLALAALIVLSAQALWVQYLNMLLQVINNSPPYDLYSIERHLLIASIYRWLMMGLRFPLEVLRAVVDFIMLTSPTALLMAVVGLFALPRDKALRWFFAMFLLIPILGALVYAQSANARGYLIYGVAILIYCCAAGGLLALYRRYGAGVALAAGTVLVVVHYGWGTAHLWGNMGPLKTYFEGIIKAFPLLVTQPQVLNLTGQEAVPALFGGAATLQEAGIAPVERLRSVESNIGYGLLARGFHTVYLLMLLLPRRKWLAAGVVGLVIAASLSAPLLLHNVPEVFNNRFALEPGTYTVQLSDEFAARVRALAQPGAVVDIRFGTAGYVGITARLGEQMLSLEPAERTLAWTMPASAFIDALQQSNSLTVTLNQPIAYAWGWQRTGLAGRALTMPTPGILPILELRLWQGNTLLLIAY